MPRRPDAELVKTSKFNELMFHFMLKRNESAIYFDIQVDLTRTFEFLEEFNKDRDEKDKLTLFQIMLTAGARTVTLRPKVNRFVSGRRLWQRNKIIFGFVVKKEKTDEGEEVNAMIEFDPYDTLDTVQKRVSAAIHEARFGENQNEQDVKLIGALPRWVMNLLFKYIMWSDQKNFAPYSVIKTTPMWVTAFIAHLGSINMDAAYHHLFEIGNAGLFITIGRIHKAAVVNQETEEIVVKKVMNCRISIDDRIADGAYTGPAVYMLRDLIESPESLVDPPELTHEQLDKLMLKKYKKGRLEREKARKKQQKKKI